MLPINTPQQLAKENLYKKHNYEKVVWNKKANSHSNHILYIEVF